MFRSNAQKFMARLRTPRGRILLIVGTAVAAVIAGLAAMGSSGAYFSDTHTGTITGSIGVVSVSTNGGNGAQNMDFQFTNLLPGTPQSATVTYQNTGSGPEDIYLTFPNATALSALNNLGTYGSAHVDSNGTEIFGSANLNDDTTTCPPGSTTTANPIPCDALPAQLKLASNVQPGATGTVTFTFAYASKLSTQPTSPTAWNTYPVTGQTTVNAVDGTGAGLPWGLVATQPGQTPA